MYDLWPQRIDVILFQENKMENNEHFKNISIYRVEQERLCWGKKF